MARYSIEDTTLTNIADAIRDKTNKTNSITVADMADEISGIQTGGNMQSKTVTPTTSTQTVTPDTNYDGLSSVTVNAIPSTYVKPSSTKAATTYTPTTSNQTIAAGTYCSGAQTIKGDANLKAENIAEGVSIFGVTGTHSGGSGGASVETCCLDVVPSPAADVLYTSMIDGVMTSAIDQDTQFASLENVVCGSTVTVIFDKDLWTANNLTEIMVLESSGTECMLIDDRCAVFKIISSADETAIVQMVAI